MFVLLLVLAAVFAVVAAGVAGGVLDGRQVVAARKQVGRASALTALLAVVVTLVAVVSGGWPVVRVTLSAALFGLSLCATLDAGRVAGRRLRAVAPAGGAAVLAGETAAAFRLLADGMLRSQTARASRAAQALTRLHG